MVRWFADRNLLRQGLLDDAVNLYTIHADQPALDAPIAGHVACADLVLNLLGGPETTIHRNLTYLGAYRVWSVNPAEDGSRRHIVDQWRGRIGRAVPKPASRALLTVDERRQQQGLLRGRLGLRSGPVLVIHPGSGGRSKCAPLDYFAALRDRATAAGWTVAWMLGPDEIERDGESCLDDVIAGDWLIREPSIARSADLLAGAGAFCGNDGGMAHLAAAIGLPTVVWFGPSDAAVWAPIGPDVTTLSFHDLDASTLVDKTVNILTCHQSTRRA